MTTIQTAAETGVITPLGDQVRSTVDVLVIGAGQAGPGRGPRTSADRRGPIRAGRAEREREIGDSWRQRYDSLTSVHAASLYSHLPGPLARRRPRGFCDTRRDGEPTSSGTRTGFELPVRRRRHGGVASSAQAAKASPRRSTTGTRIQARVSRRGGHSALNMPTPAKPRLTPRARRQRSSGSRPCFVPQPVERSGGSRARRRRRGERPSGRPRQELATVHRAVVLADGQGSGTLAPQRVAGPEPLLVAGSPGP